MNTDASEIWSSTYGSWKVSISMLALKMEMLPEATLQSDDFGVVILLQYFLPSSRIIGRSI